MTSKAPKKRKPAKKARKSKPKTKRSNKSQIKWFKNKLFLKVVLLLFVVFSAYIAYLDFKIISKFEGKIWSLPSHVYARPLELYVDKAISAQQFEKELKLIGYVKSESMPTRSGYYRQWNNRHFEIITRDFVFHDGYQKGKALRVDFSDGKVSGLYELYTHDEVALARLEPALIAGIYPTQAEDRKLVQLEDVPKLLVLTLLAVEDRRFYQHWGVDPRAIARAFLANITAGGAVQGGSTLTQQLVKNLFLTSERSLIRKINEAFMALLLEFHYDKTLILETYINEIYLGQSGAHGIHGFELASHYYFDKPLKKLSREQMALLVGIVKGASWYDPRRHPERAIKRRNQVLQQMAELDVISDGLLQRLMKKPLGLAPKFYRATNQYPAFIDLVKRQLRKDYAEDDLRTSGLKIFTTLDPLVQSQVEQSVTNIIPKLKKQYDDAKELQSAAIIASPENGEIQALVGDSNPRFAGFNRALDATRQVGSLIKPGIYLSALQKSNQFTLATHLSDQQLRLKGTDGKIWAPQNYDKKYLGDILLYQSLMHSRNVPTVRLGLKVGLADIIKTLNALGIEREVPPYPSMTLGAFNLTPFDVAEMYQTLAAKGFNIPLRAIREVTDVEGKLLNRYPIKLKQTLKNDQVYLVNTVLNKVTESGTAKSIQSHIKTKVAGKTGTTDDLRDSWFAGFSEDRLAVVWLGRDDNQPTGLTGASGALKLWVDVMSQISLQDFDLTPPENISMHWIDEESGGISKKTCKGTVELPFIIGTEPTQRAECKSRTLLDAIKGIFE